MILKRPGCLTLSSKLESGNGGGVWQRNRCTGGAWEIDQKGYVKGALQERGRADRFARLNYYSSLS